MKIGIRQKLFLFSLIVLAGNGVVGYSFYESNKKLHDSEQWVHHTEQVIYQSRNILSIAKDIETASRGFVITNDSSFLEPLYVAEKTTSSNLARLRQTITDNRTQQRRADSVDFYMHKLLDFSLKMVELRSKRGLTAAIAYTSSKQGRHYFSRVRQITYVIQGEESALLKLRKHANERTLKAFKLFIRIIFLSMVGFTILLLIFIGKYLLKNEEKEKRTAELAIANQERTKMVNDLMLRNIDLEQFAYIISHNLRTPVANIIGASSALNDPELDAEDKATLLKGISVSVLRLDDIVKDLNQILQVKWDINETKELVRCSELLEDIMFGIKNLIDKYKIEIKYDFSEIDELLTVKPYLYSIFYNLISNSVKYRRQDIPCIIESKSCLENNKVHLIFTDNGMGIDLKKCGDHIFGLYKRFHTNIEGKGMGLFMVKTQVETLGGKISVHSRENEGTEFKIEFEILNTKNVKNV
ncbi:MAG TPA: CHASE3 domain-containing protein [Mucilaginibacter sp.]|jgi:signal transduction histidine kinase